MSCGIFGEWGIAIAVANEGRVAFVPNATYTGTLFKKHKHEERGDLPSAILASKPHALRSSLYSRAFLCPHERQKKRRGPKEELLFFLLFFENSPLSRLGVREPGWPLSLRRRRVISAVLLEVADFTTLIASALVVSQFAFNHPLDP